MLQRIEGSSLDVLVREPECKPCAKTSLVVCRDDEAGYPSDILHCLYSRDMYLMEDNGVALHPKINFTILTPDLSKNIPC